MPVKSLLVTVELAIRKVSCPGVWLCSNGKLSLQIYMLDSVIQTDSHKPMFPLLFDEKFVFYKTFLKERRLSELQRSLGRELFSADLIQWRNCDEGVILASFRTTLDDLLYPYTITSRNKDSENVDLLMEPTKLFPGTISPKLELRTQTSIKETFSGLKHSQSPGHRTTKKILNCRREKKKVYPRKVCHTVEYSKEQQRCPKANTDKRPIFQYRKPEENLIMRTNPNKVTCEGELSSTILPIPKTPSFAKRICKSFPKRREMACSCTSCPKSTPSLCPLCSKYICTFSTKSEDCETNQNSLKLCSYCQENFAIHKEYCCCTCEKSVSDTQPEKKVCFCLSGQRASDLVHRLHDKVINTLNAGSATLESCLGECAICE